MFTSAEPFATAMTENAPRARCGWITGPKVLEHFSGCEEPDLALTALDHALRSGKQIATPTSVEYPRPSGVRQTELNIQPITPEIWTRIKTLAPNVDIWRAVEFNLPATSHEKPVYIRGLRFDEDAVLEIALDYGADDSRKLVGGANSRDHGAVAAQLVFDLLQRGPDKVARLTGISLVPDVEKLYLETESRRGKPNPKNSERLANGVLAVVKGHFGSTGAALLP